MTTLAMDLTDSAATSPQIVHASSLTLSLPRPPRKFFRHGWQSWTLTTWVDPAEPMTPISAHQTRAKDEDAPYAFSDHPVSAWVGAAEMADDKIVLLGALDLSGRIELVGSEMRGFYEDGREGKWLVASGEEKEIFKTYTDELQKIFGVVNPPSNPPRVWCSWYSLYNTINEPVMDKVLRGLGDLPFDVVQLDDGWQVSLGEWEANKKFPSGMKALADKIRKTGRAAGIWLSPFITPRNSRFAREHADWLLRDEAGNPVYAGLGWSGDLTALDSSHPEVQEWLGRVIRNVVGWGFSYLKLDFLYAAAIPGRRKRDLPRETACREAMQVIRDAAGRDTYLLACGSPILPVLGLCDGMRISTDVTPYWSSKPLSVWLNNPNNPGTQNAIRTSLHRLWLKDLVHIDPDVVYFRTRNNRMTREQAGLMHNMARITSFKATSDLPHWLKPEERAALRAFLEEQPEIEQVSRYEFKINRRAVDFASVIPRPAPVRFPPQLAIYAGTVQAGFYELLPGLIESQKARLAK
ncbi:MAG: glycoside hydrolase family 36 protein [Chloroflexota bacterium]